MKKIAKKILAVILCLSIAVGVCSASVSAAVAAEEKANKITFIEVLGDVAEAFVKGEIKKEGTIGEFVNYVGNFEYLANTLKAFGGAFADFGEIVKYNDFGGSAEKIMYNLVNVLANQLLDVICALFPEPKSIIDIEDYQSENFYAGHDELITEAADGAKWSLGYANASLIPQPFQAGVYDMGGSLHVMPVKATEILDDMKIRVTCIDDGSGRGAVIMAVIDCLGISSTDVRRIREQVADFAEENNIVSINISATHSHSCIDLQGVGSAFISSVVWNAVSGEYNVGKTVSGRNEQFMNNLYTVSANAIKEAYNDMAEGELYYSKGDISKFVKDKEPPYLFVNDAACFKFVPDDGTESTYFVNMTCHATSLPHTTTTQVSGDFIYYMEQQFNRSGYNFMYIQGAVGAVTKITDNIYLPENASDVDVMNYFGIALADYFMDLNSKGAEVVEPILNARGTEYLVKCSNNLLMLAIKTQLLNNCIVRVGDDFSNESYRLVTEMNYVTFGDKVMFGFIPCEMYPEVSIGGAASAEESWTNREWNLSLIDCVDDRFDYYTVCFANDTYGYVMADNSYAFLYPGSPADTLLSAGGNIATQTVNAFEALLALDDYNNK